MEAHFKTPIWLWYMKALLNEPWSNNPHFMKNNMLTKCYIFPLCIKELDTAKYQYIMEYLCIKHEEDLIWIKMT